MAGSCRPTALSGEAVESASCSSPAREDAAGDPLAPPPRTDGVALGWAVGAGATLGRAGVGGCGATAGGNCASVAVPGFWGVSSPRWLGSMGSGLSGSVAPDPSGLLAPGFAGVPGRSIGPAGAGPDWG